MKRSIFIISALLLGVTLKAQEVTYTCRYWFDQNFAQAVTTIVSEIDWDAELDVGDLSEGLHVLHLHVLTADSVSMLNIEGDSLYSMMDTVVMKWSAPQNYLFMKLTPPALSSEFIYKYWFDQDHASMQSGNLGDGHLLLDVNDLSEGLHAIHVMLKGGEYSNSQNYLFFKADAWENGTPTYMCHCWFDEDFTNRQTNDLGSGHLFFDVTDLGEGMHTVHVLVEGTALTSTQSYLFMKAALFAADSVDMSLLTYRCWFDEDFEHQQMDSLGDGHFMLDVNDLEDGLHTVHVMLEGSALTATHSYMFMKMAVESPSTEMQYICWFDQDYGHAQTGLLGSGIFELDVSDLSNGLHTVNVQLNNGSLTTPLTYLFYKQPLGGYGVARWEYWVNDDFADRSITILPASVDTLEIISLLPVGHPAIRSSCFHFHPNGEEPYINAKNQITIRIWDTELHYMDMKRYYVDEQVQQDIVAQVFDCNTTNTFAAPRDNLIKWFKLDAVVGDSLSFKANKACTMQLFAPSGEEVFNVSGSESITLHGLHAWEDGTYYLAVHDVTGSGETLSVTYNWIAKYVVLAYTPTEIGNTWGVFEVDVLGNGFDKLSNVLLVNGAIEWQMDTVMYSHISEAAIRFAMNSTTSNGNYDVVLCFEDQVGELDTLVLTSAIQVVEAQFGTIDIDYSYQFNTTQPYLITVTITNNGNVEYQGVPVLFAHTNVNNVEFGLYNDWITVQEDYFENGGRGIYYTNNLFNQGVEGNLIPLIIPRLGPHGTRDITFNVDAVRGTGFDFYAWGGIPWSLKTQQAYDADNYYCQTHPESPGWNGNHNGGNGGNSGSAHGSNGGSSGGASYTVGTHNANGGNCHGTASDAYFDSCDGPPDPCDIAGHVAGDIQECLCGVTMGIGQTLGNMLNAMHGLNHRAQLNGVGIHSQEEAEQYGLGDMWRSAYQRRLRTPGSLLRDAVGHSTGFLPDAAQHAADAGIEAWGMLSDDCAQPPRQSPSIPRPCEPNEIRGYVAESGSHYMMQEIQTITYEIESENDTTATAAAHTIIVRDTLDINKFDVASLAAYRITIHDKVLELSGEHNFVYTLDLRPNVYVIAQIQLECDDETGIVVWTITSLDPMTMEPTTDPNQGALPINYNGEGIATFTFNVDLKEPFPDGTEISNRVGIIFDLEEPVITDTWTNTVDAVKPTSHIEEVTPVPDSLSFSFVSEDNRSGVWYHSLYYRNDSTDMQWQVKKPQITENSLMLYFDDFQTTEYLVMAVDSAGNIEEKEMVAEYIYYYEGPGPATQTDDLSAGWNWWSTYIEMNGANGLELLENGLGTNGLNIKSGNGNSVEYIPDWEMWWGDEIEVRNESMYEINVAQAGTVTVAGTQAIPGAHPITLAPGWNWIGYPVNASLPTETALASLSPSEEDVIQSRNGYSMYWPDFGFWGDVEYMTPGSGYKYMSNNAQPQTLTYPSSRGKALAYKPKTVETRPEAMQHQYLMDIVAVAELEGEELKTGHYELIALSDGQPRGRASLMYCEPNGRHVAMLVVYGDASETLEFRLLDTESGRVYEGLERMDFKAEKVVGGLRKPFTMHFGKEQEDAFALEGMFPNPAKAGETVYVNMVDTSVEEGTSGIELYNALGEHIPVTCTMGSPLSFKAPQAAGVYMVRLTSRGEVYHGTLIVTH